MKTPKLHFEEMLWQLDLLAQQWPELLEVALPGQDEPLKLEPKDWAINVMKHFRYTCFSDFSSFLKELETRYTDAHNKVGTVEKAIFAYWSELRNMGDDNILFSVVDTGLFPKFAEDYRSVYVDSPQRKVGLSMLYDPFELDTFGQRGEGVFERGYSQLELAGRLARKGPYRKFTFSLDALERLSDLRQTCPNFVDVTEAIMDAVALSVRCARPIRMTPILLVGEGGIGKSHYSEQLSKCLEVPIANVACDNLQEGAAISGSSYIYGNSQPGQIFKVLVENDHVSPVVILDELDKAGMSQHGDTLSPLHNLLEPSTAKRFRDASMDLAVDASRIIWIATANDLGRIPRSLMSRFEIFNISFSDPSVQMDILMGTCRELESEYQHMTFASEVLEAVLDRTPREQRQLLQRALSRASRLNEPVVTVEHLKLVTHLGLEPNPNSRKSIGYL